MNVTQDAVYAPSDNIVAREIEGELIIVPLIAGIGDTEDELFTLNETGKAIWNKLDGRHSIEQVVRQLHAEFEAPIEQIEQDVVGLVKELLKRKILERA